MQGAMQRAVQGAPHACHRCRSARRFFLCLVSWRWSKYIWRGGWLAGSSWLAGEGCRGGGVQGCRGAGWPHSCQPNSCTSRNGTFAHAGNKGRAGDEGPPTQLQFERATSRRHLVKKKRRRAVRKFPQCGTAFQLWSGKRLFQLNQTPVRSGALFIIWGRKINKNEKRTN